MSKEKNPTETYYSARDKADDIRGAIGKAQRARMLAQLRIDEAQKEIKELDRSIPILRDKFEKSRTEENEAWKEMRKCL